MSKLSRYIQPEVSEDLKEKMVFIGGPRQVGKTTMARSIAQVSYDSSQYLNWDNKLERKKILEYQFNTNSDLMIFDEIHKYRPWKSHIKGIFDTMRERFDILVTGSARLDIYRKGGDSLQGRYHYYRLHPFSVAEACLSKWHGKIFEEIPIQASRSEEKEALEALLKFGGFPEPFFMQSERSLRRWHLQRNERLVKEDIRDLESIRDLSQLEILVSLLPERAGSPLSINALREDLQLAHKTVEHWITILERMYYMFSLSPFAASSIRSLKKEKKLYLWDWSEIENPGHRLENLIASHLLKFVHYLTDHTGYPAELHCIRDREKREVDFLVSIKRKPWFCVEAKASETDISQALLYFKERLKVPFAYQVIGRDGIDLYKKDIRIVSASSFLKALV